MEENNYKHEDFDNCFLCKHPVLKHVLIGLLVFLGAFAAFYVVADWHFKRMLDPMIQMRNMDRAMMRQERQFDRMARKEINHQYRMEKDAARFINVEKTKDAYRIIIDLVPFGNNENNVEVKANGSMLTINAAGTKNSKHSNETLRYSQTFDFGDNIDIHNITKVRQGNNYIISVPVD